MGRRLTQLVLAFMTAVLVGLPASAGATLYDLKADWSDANNPNGVWTYRQGATNLPSQSDYDRDHVYIANQAAWAHAQFDLNEPYNNVGHVPVWLRAKEDGLWGGDFKAGDIMMHPASVNSSYPYGEGYVLWISPIVGTIKISGNVWYGEQLPGRSVDWHLLVNGAQIASGTVAYGDSYDRDNPMTFGVFNQTVNVGDQVVFEGVRTAGAIPWWIGVNLSIEAIPVPVPPSLWLVGAGLVNLLGLGAWRRL